MGRTLKALASKELNNTPSVFNNRMVVEVCENIHVHYRNLRINLSLKDWSNLSTGLVDAFHRWKKIGKPNPGKTHIELCRKEVAKEPIGDNIQINLNENLYERNKNTIFSEGSVIEDPVYIHLKIRDLRIELSIKEFELLSEAVAEATKQLSQHLETDGI